MTEQSLKRSGRRLTIAPGYEEDRLQTHGYEATTEAALEALARV
jgi:hypothetical protein